MTCFTIEQDFYQRGNCDMKSIGEEKENDLKSDGGQKNSTINQELIIYTAVFQRVHLHSARSSDSIDSCIWRICKMELAS